MLCRAVLRPRRRRLVSTKQAILRVAGKSELLQAHRCNSIGSRMSSSGGGAAGAAQFSTPNLDVKIHLRAPYVAPLNIMQCICLKAIREFQGRVDRGEDIEKGGFWYRV